MKNIKNKLIIFLLRCLTNESLANRSEIVDWAKSSYVNAGFVAYCEGRIENLTKYISTYRGEKDYIRTIGAIEEIRIMQFFVKERATRAKKK